MKILLFGRNGQIGWELNRSLLPLGNIVALGRDEVDFLKLESLRKIVRDVSPDVIVNAAAYTAVDKAESEEDVATVINGAAPGVLAEEACRINALLVHYSTDYIFDGTKTEPYTENDTPNPLNAYGRSKLAGERAIEASGCDYLTLRTSWVYSARGKNFLLTVLRLAGERKELKIVGDQFGAPTWARNIADVTGHVLATSRSERESNRFVSGICHLSASGKTSWHGFSNAIVVRARQLDTGGKYITESVLPITTEEYPLPAQRPKNSQMASVLLTKRFGVVMDDWHHSMELCVDEALRNI